MRCGDARPGRVVSTTSSTGRRRDSHSRARYRRGRARATRDADEGTSTSALTPEQLREKLASVTRRMERARGREGTFESVERANGRAKTSNDDGDDVDASPTTARDIDRRVHSRSIVDRETRVRTVASSLERGSRVSRRGRPRRGIVVVGFSVGVRARAARGRRTVDA